MVTPIVIPHGICLILINEGHSFGITAAGESRLAACRMDWRGEPTIDMLGVDPRRYGSYAISLLSKKVKNEEAYANVFVTHYPDEERVEGRPLRTAPVMTD